MVKSFRVTTILLASALVLASATYSTAAKTAKKPASNAALISQGKALVSQYRCNGCHGADFKGRPGRTPNITSKGELKDYNLAKFETLLDTGVKDSGRPLEGMPAFHLKAAQSKPIYAYLKSLK